MKKVKIGREFESIEAHVDDEREVVSVIKAVLRGRENVTRKTVAYLVMAMVAVFILGAAVLGLLSGSFGALQAVWVCVAPFVGMIIVHYFPGSGEGNDTEKG